MFNNMGKTNPQDLGNGGTIDGNLTITGDLQVDGGGSLSFDEIIEGTQVIDVTSTEALLVRKDGDGGDIFSVDTTNSKVVATELDISGNIDVDGTTNLDAVDIDGNVQLDGTFTIGTDGSGYDVTFYSATAGDSLVWDASEEKLTITGTNGQTALDVADGNLVVADNVDIEGDIDVNGTANLDTVDIDGDVDISGSITMGGNITITNNTGTVSYLNLDADGDADSKFRIVFKADKPSDGNGIGDIQFFNNGASPVTEILALRGSTDIKGDLVFNTSNSERLRIDEDGNLRISSTNKLEFGDDGTYIHQSADGTLDLVADTILELNGGAGSMKIDADSVISLSNNDSGTGNTIFGHDSATPDSGGNYNVVIGEEASKDLTTGDGNISIGYQSLFKNTDKSYNVAIGGGALYFAKGHFNTGIGYYSGRGTDNYTGTNNISIGYQTAGDISGSRNISIGDYAGHTGTNNLTTGVNNVLIGVEAEVSAAGASNQIAIGYLAEAQADNSVTLGNENVTAVYMAQDSGAMVHSGGLTTSGAVLTQGMSDDTDRFVVTDDGSNYKGGIAKKSGSMGGLFVRGASSKIGVLTNSSYASNPSGDTEALMVSSADASTTFGGTIIPNAGINFPDTPVESNDANTLDDYEEGLVTNLSITFGGNSAGQTYNSSRNQARYTKVGNRVFIGGFIELSAKGSSTGAAKISGLPFTIQNHTGANSGGSIGYLYDVSFADFPMLAGEANTTNISFAEPTNAGATTTLTEGNFTDNSNIIFSFHYNTQ